MPTEYPPNTSWPPAQQQYPAMPPQLPAPQPGVVWLPPVANDRSGLRVMGGLAILSALFAGFPLISANLESAQSSFAGRVGFIFVLLFLSLLLIYGISMFLQASHWSIINQRRQAAAAYGSASGVSLADPQPFPNIEALPLPFTIKLKTNWGLVTPLSCLLVGFLFFLQLNNYSQRGWSFQQSLAHIANNWPFLVALPLGIFAFNFVWIMWAIVPPSIQVTAQGLIIRHPIYDWFKTTSGPFWKWGIPWSEARLFAIREGKPGASTVRYELSSPFRVVTFSRIIRPRWWSLYRPAQPFGEYNAQMDALLALISAKTGLLLYDVRQAPSTEIRPKGISPSVITTLSAVLGGLSFCCQVEGFPGVLFAKLHDDYRPVALLLEITACFLALAGLGFGYRVRVPDYRARLLLLGYLCLALAIIGLVLFPFGPFVH